MAKLVIVESPTKARTLGNFLGKEYELAASFGHIRDLPKSNLGIDIENNFTPQYIIPTKSRKTVNSLKKLVSGSSETILATDEDREGEAIAYHLKEILGLKNYQRIVFHEITERAVKEALKNPRQLYESVVDAQTARRVLDRIVGYKLSPLLWKKVARGLSAGRVQSAAVRLIVEREREIEKFKAEEYWSVIASLKTKNEKGKAQNNNGKTENEFEAGLIKKDDKIIPKLGIKTQKEAEEIVNDLKGAVFEVKTIEKKSVKRNPLPPFTTSTLQQTAGQKLGISSQKTMSLAQNLYERGLITYHRTDSLNLSSESVFAAKEYIIENLGERYWPGFPRKYKTKSKGAQEAHEAIRPSNPQNNHKKINLERPQARLYGLIWSRFMASQMSEAVFDSTDVKIKAETLRGQNPDSQYLLQAKGQTLKFDGFLKIYPLQFGENEIPEMEEKETLDLIKLTPSQHFTQPPSRYNEPSLIKTLELNGIGRPSTYAPIISTIQKRNYVFKNEQKRFQPSEIGTVVNDLLVKHFPEIVDIKFTAKMEADLDGVAEGKEKWQKVVGDFYYPFAETLSKKEKELSKQEIAEEKTDKICPTCGAEMIIKLGRFGKFYACTNFPKCRYTESLKDNKLGIPCPKCGQGEITEKRTKRGKIFYGCDKFPKCDFALWDKPTGEKCEKCGALMVITKRRQTKCSNKECEKNVKKVEK
ncbi:MAG: type I DNA topoisomerase [Parcubacteria group bacterium CG08_land_8_20_14_0_20_43_9]|nr:MAG: type I DNA topoisomerase [Parcubacteria group bacterium CG08_land_8_20_14_0_20_43_9]